MELFYVKIHSLFPHEDIVSKIIWQYNKLRDCIQCAMKSNISSATLNQTTVMALRTAFFNLKNGYHAEELYQQSFGMFVYQHCER